MKGRVVYDRQGNRTACSIDGKPVSPEEFDRAFPPKEMGEPLPSQHSACWPLLSDALAVHPKQIEEAMARDRRHGLATEYAPDGRMILADRGQRRDVMKSLGIHDNNGGFGD